VRETRKARRLAHLAEVLPQIRRNIARHLGTSEPTQAFSLSAVIELVARSAIRPGSEQPARPGGSLDSAASSPSQRSSFAPSLEGCFCRSSWAPKTAVRSAASAEPCGQARVRGQFEGPEGRSRSLVSIRSAIFRSRATSESSSLRIRPSTSMLRRNRSNKKQCAR
jgi:DNA topoisomerase-1